MARDTKESIINPTVSIIIPHFKNQDILHNCLDSIFASDCTESIEVIIVDNGNNEYIKSTKNSFPEIIILNPNKNIGYAGGCNFGAEKARGEFLFFLNDDTTINKKCISKLINKIQVDKKIGSAQPKILNEKHKNYFDYAGGTGGFIDIFCYPFTRGRIFNTIETDEKQYDNDKKLFWASGCAFITIKKIFLKIGGFDETLFAHMEEIDYHWKLHLMGYNTMSCTESVVYHKGAMTLPTESPMKTYLNHRNNLLLFITNHNFFITALLSCVRLPLELISLIYNLFKGPKHCIAHIGGIIWIIFHPFYIIKRKMNINKIKSKPLYSIIKKMYLGSVVLGYFIFRRKKYSDIF